MNDITEPLAPLTDERVRELSNLARCGPDVVAMAQEVQRWREQDNTGIAACMRLNAKLRDERDEALRVRDAVVILLRAKTNDADWGKYPESLQGAVECEYAELRAELAVTEAENARMTEAIASACDDAEAVGYYGVDLDSAMVCFRYALYLNVIRSIADLLGVDPCAPDAVIAAVRSQSGLEERVAEWVKTRIGVEHMQPRERAMRLLEEAVELAQAEGILRAQAYAQLGHVYDRAVGHAPQEAAGVAVCLLAWCAATGNRFADLALREIERIEAKPLDQIRGSLARKADADLVVTIDEANEGAKR